MSNLLLETISFVASDKAKTLAERYALINYLLKYKEQ